MSHAKLDHGVIFNLSIPGERTQSTRNSGDSQPWLLVTVTYEQSWLSARETTIALIAHVGGSFQFKYRVGRTWYQKTFIDSERT